MDTLLGALLFTATLAGQSTKAGSPHADLFPLPEVYLGTVEPAVREQLLAQRSELEARLERQDLPQEQAAQAWGETGQLYLLYDLTAPAEACLRNASTLAPSSFRWHYLLGSLYRLDNRLDEAAAAYERALEISPGDGAALVHLANVNLRRSRPELAEPLYQRALAQPDFAAAAHYGLGRIAAENGDAAAAIRHFEQALALQPAADALHYHLGRGYGKLGETEKMRQHLAWRGETEVRFPDEIALELQGEATGVGAWLSLGRLSMNSGALDVAEQRFSKALEIDPSSPAAHRSLASALQRQGRLEDALEHYEQAVRLDPDYAGQRYFVAQSLIDGAFGEVADGDLRAIEHLRAALAQEPGYLPGWVQLSGAYERLGALVEAERALLEAMKLAPQAVDLRQHHVDLLRRLGRGEAAAAELDALAASGQGSLEERMVIARGLLAEGRRDAAEPILRELVEAPALDSARRGWAAFQLGNLAAERSDLDAAVAHYQQALVLAPDLLEAYFNLGTVYGRMGRYREAALHQGRVLAFAPDNHQARYAEAMALVLAGDYAEARVRLERALELFPSEAPYAHLLARLLVCAPDAEQRDGAVGLDLAQRLFDAFPTTDHAETVAMALAEQGDFELAARWQERVVAELESGGRTAEAATARRRLDLYRQGQPVRTPWLEA